MTMKGRMHLPHVSKEKMSVMQKVFHCIQQNGSHPPTNVLMSNNQNFTTKAQRAPKMVPTWEMRSVLCTQAASGLKEPLISTPACHTDISIFYVCPL